MISVKLGSLIRFPLLQKLEDTIVKPIELEVMLGIKALVFDKTIADARLGRRGELTAS